MPFDQRSLIHREAWFPPCFVRQNQQQKKTYFCAAILDYFQTKNFKCQTTSFHYFSPRIPNLKKNIGHPTSGSGGKKTVKRDLKSEQTDTQTHGQTDILTNRLIESIGPEGRCFEKTSRGQHDQGGQNCNSSTVQCTVFNYTV